MKIDAKLNIIEEVHSIATQKLSNAIEMIRHLNISNMKKRYFLTKYFDKETFLFGNVRRITEFKHISK